MHLYTMKYRFPTQADCIAHIEHVRFAGKPYCPHCQSAEVKPRVDRNREGRWNCHACKNTFSALTKTVFQNTKVDLRKWFVAIHILLNKGDISSHELSRRLELNQKSAWYMIRRVKEAMGTGQRQLLTDILNKPRNADRVIKMMAERIVEKFSPLQILLFGSRARGDAEDESDIDLIVVFPEIKDRNALAVNVALEIKDFGFDKDVLVTTPEEYALGSNCTGHAFYYAAKDAKVLYEAPIP